MKARPGGVAALVHTAFGLVGVELGAGGVRQLRLPEATERAAWDALGGPGPERRAGPRALGDLARRIQAYFRGEPAAFPDPVDLAGAPPFFQEVYVAARSIPYGRRVSYGELARRAGRPAAARAVGQALARNPVTIIIP